MMNNLIKSVVIAMSLMGATVVTFADNDYDDLHERKIQRSVKISSAQAKKIALQSVGKNSRLKSIDFDTDGRPHYDVEVLKGRTEYTVKVDARTGKVYSKYIDN